MYSLRTLFLTTAIAATSCALLAKPSVWATIVSPVLFALLIGVAVFNAMSSDGARKHFWATFVAILVGYLMTASFAILTLDRISGRSLWQHTIAEPAWKLLHDEMPWRTTTVVTGYDYSNLAGFTVTLHLVIALVTATIGAFICQFVLMRSADANMSTRGINK